MALGWLAGRMRWLGDAQADPARVLGNAAFYIFVPALLFRTTARVDLGALPGGLLLAYFVPALALLLAVYGVQQLRQRRAAAARAARPACAPSRSTYGNAVQMGIPMAAAMFGEAGLGIHLMLVSVHGADPAVAADRAGRTGPGAQPGAAASAAPVADAAQHAAQHGHPSGGAAGAGRA